MIVSIGGGDGVIGNLSLDQLRVLVTIADMGSFSAAGRKLGRVQSAISQAVATLELVQGVALFDRSGHRPQLPEVGRVLVDQARLVLASAGRFEAIAAGTRQGLQPDLALAIDPLVPTAPLIDSLRALSETFPDLPVSFSTDWAARCGGCVAARQRSRSACCFRTFPKTLLPTSCCGLPCSPSWRPAILWRCWDALPREATWSHTSNWCFPIRSILAGRPMVFRAGRVPGRGVGAVGKSPAGATAKSLA